MWSPSRFCRSQSGWGLHHRACYVHCLCKSSTATASWLWRFTNWYGSPVYISPDQHEPFQGEFPNPGSSSIFNSGYRIATVHDKVWKKVFVLLCNKVTELHLACDCLTTLGTVKVNRWHGQTQTQPKPDQCKVTQCAGDTVRHDTRQPQSCADYCNARNIDFSVSNRICLLLWHLADGSANCKLYRFEAGDGHFIFTSYNGNWCQIRKFHQCGVCFWYVFQTWRCL